MNGEKEIVGQMSNNIKHETTSHLAKNQKSNSSTELFQFQ